MRQSAAMDDACAEIVPLTVGETAYQRIRADIVFGRMPPGQKLRLDRMKARVRRRHRHAARDPEPARRPRGWSLAEGQRGFEVPPVTARNLRELAGLRLLLESAARSSSPSPPATWSGRAAWWRRTTSSSGSSGGSSPGARETALWKRYDGEFHQALISACGSRELMAAHARPSTSTCAT